KFASDQSLFVYLGGKITLEIHERIVKLLRLIESNPITGVRNVHPAYCSLLFQFNFFILDHEKLEAILREYLSQLKAVVLAESRHVEIPVCYGGEFGPDLSDVAALHNMSISHVIELHSSVTYIVYFLGFVPGFAYLGGLSEQLETLCLSTPRRKVPPGSVGIAGQQAGVYPCATPGGWRLLGRTAEVMFQPQREHMSLLSIGDRVRFVPISEEEFRTRKTA